jgi:hypothetical protein
VVARNVSRLELLVGDVVADGLNVSFPDGVGTAEPAGD